MFPLPPSAILQWVKNLLQHFGMKLWLILSSELFKMSDRRHLFFWCRGQTPGRGRGKWQQKLLHLWAESCRGGSGLQKDGDHCSCTKTKRLLVFSPQQENYIGLYWQPLVPVPSFLSKELPKITKKKKKERVRGWRGCAYCFQIMTLINFSFQR